MEPAIKHCTAGIGIWEWAPDDVGGEPDVVTPSVAMCPCCAGIMPSNNDVFFPRGWVAGASQRDTFANAWKNDPLMFLFSPRLQD
jgi:hypothetical protein